jgi:uncharacterized membrane protein (UPF0136 family)
MWLPFARSEFLETFAAYNLAWWPAALLLWLLTLGALVIVYRRSSGAGVLFSTVLGVQWAWAGAVYHLGFFRQINPAATGFGLLFLAEAALILRLGTVGRRLAFEPSRSPWGRLGGVLMAYSLLYPVIGMLSGLRYPAIPTFGVPCPTTILTVGALLTIPRPAARLPAIAPIAWTAIGGSAAFLLGMRADLMLPIAGVLVLLYILTPDRGAGPAPGGERRQPGSHAAPIR